MLQIRQVSYLIPFLEFLTALKIKSNFLSLACKAILDMVLVQSDHIYHSPPRSLCFRCTSFSWVLRYATHIPASGPLRLLLPPRGMIIPQSLACLIPSLCPRLCSNVIPSKRHPYLQTFLWPCLIFLHSTQNSLKLYLCLLVCLCHQNVSTGSVVLSTARHPVLRPGTYHMLVP